MTLLPHSNPQSQPVGLANMLALAELPFLKKGVTAHYEGSIDKLGGNADWDWWLYQDDRGEWVLLDVDGPGCIYNFVQHRYPTSSEPVFRFYFDGETEPRFSIKHSEFGQKHPFIAPLADCFYGDDVPPQGRGPIRVVRSFVPMPYRSGCRITSSVKLEGAAKTQGEGGWGNVHYHEYTSDEGIQTFNGREDYEPLLTLWNNPGSDPKPTTGNEIVASQVPLVPSKAVTLLDRSGPGAVASLRLQLTPFDSNRLRDVWLVIRWDDLATPAVECPIGAFFGNEIGNNRIGLLTHGQQPDGTLYCHFPMPYWKSAHIELQYRAIGPQLQIAYEISITPPSVRTYPQHHCGYFRAAPYYTDTPVILGQDSHIGIAQGHGHIVAATLTGLSVGGKYVSCEGDVRLHLDGMATPQIESDGSESYACYGWGFVAPPQVNPASAYDGVGCHPWSWCETRVHTGDWIPFQSSFRFGLEAGDRNDTEMRHSGLILYYGIDQPGQQLTDTLDIGNPESEKAHDYRIVGQVWAGELAASYEGDDDHIVTAHTGRAFTGASEFTVQIDPQNRGVRLRRRADQLHGRQRARIYIDGKLMRERTWYFADRNPHHRWLDHEIDLPAAYTCGKSQLRIRLEYVPSGDAPAWTEFTYWVYSLVEGAST